MADTGALRTAADRLKEDWLIVTDLDGTLLDHYNYSHAAVDGLLADLDRRDIPVIFNTSKTFAELEELRGKLGNQHPFVVENGSAIYIPPAYFPDEPPDADWRHGYRCLALGKPVAAIHHWLARIRNELRADFTSFAEMTTEELVRATGLTEQQAARAAQREFSEAIQWRGSESQRAAFQEAAQSAGFKALQGGRFIHLLGQCDKGSATQRLVSEYDDKRGQKHSVIAAGDGPNDVDMLAVADLAIAIRSPAHDFPSLPTTANVVRSGEYGPEGWAKVVELLLELKDQR
jgi:mannosyl-3-phosphoglycerate phosphatase